MTVSNTTSVVQYNGNGATVAWPTGFRFFKNTDLVVTKRSVSGATTLLTLNTDYSVTGANSVTGGTVTTTNPLLGGPAPELLTIARVLTVQQLTDLRNQGDYFAEIHEDVFDYLTMLVQQTGESDSRALRHPRDAEHYQAEARRIVDMEDPVDQQDATTKGWVSNHFASLIDQVTGLINTTTGIIYDAGTLFDHLRFGVARTVDSIAALKSLSSARNQRAFVMGYYAANDGGGGHYRVRVGDVSTADNGGTIIVANDGARWELVVTDRVSLKQFGAKGDGTTVDSTFIQKAFDSGLPLYAGPGTYILTLWQTMQMEGGSTFAALKIASSLNLQGAGRDLVSFKMKNNESTDASPKYFNMIGINTVVQGLYIDGITFDLNGQNNKISPDRAGLVYNYFNCAALMVSGSFGTVGQDARLINATFTNNRVKNSPGVTAISLGQSNAAGYTLGNNIEIAYNIFQDNGLDCNDHSSIYMWANNVKVHHNLFTNSVMSSGVQGPLAAAELHGSQNWFHHNTVNNYLWGVYVAGNFSGISRGQFVHDNEFFVAQKAVIFFNETIAEPGMADINIHDNHVWLTDDFRHLGGEPKRAFDLTPSQGNVDGVKVHGNTLLCTDLYGAIAIHIGVLAIGRSIKNVSVTNNETKGFATPIQFGTTGGGSVEGLSIDSNQLLDIKPNITAPTFTIAIYGKAANGSVKISNNKGQGVTSAHPYFGVLLDTGTMSNLDMQNNQFDAGTAAPISDTVIVVGRRSGAQALRFAALPTQGTWTIDQEIDKIGAIEEGTAGTKYMILGWRRMTNGTGNTGTDWLQRRALTGN
ncbi:phage tail fiber domain-containing protein [Pseudomonas sp. TMB3-21]